MHKRAGNRIVVGRDGMIITLEPDAISVPELNDIEEDMDAKVSREEQEEFFVHFVSCIEDLNRAWWILKLVKRRKKNSLAFAAFQFALIEYSKPYLNSVGTIRKYRLTGEFVPTEHKELHQRILDSRNQLLAHSDLTIKEAKLYVSETLSGKFASPVQNVLDRTAEARNIDSIIDLIEKTLNKMYEKEEELKSKLEPNF